jgi:general secretion pathway protein J
MLVAVAIFALASALAFGGLSSLLRTRDQLDLANERLGRLQFAVGLIERDVRSVSTRGIRDAYGAPRAALEGGSDRIELTRNGFANSLLAPRAELERIGYRVIDGELRRERYVMLDRTPATAHIEDSLITEVERIEWRYLDRNGREFGQWPPPRAASEQLPRAVVVTLALRDFGDVRRVLELPDEAVP